jgi:hypothetical protein
MLGGVLYLTAAVGGVVLGPFALRAVVGLLPSGMGEDAARWQLHRALSMGDGWLVHQSGDREYVLEHIEGDRDIASVRGETLDLNHLGHISTKTGSVPMGVSYGPGAVEDSPLVGVDDDSHVSDDEVEGDGDDGDGGGSGVTGPSFSDIKETWAIESTGGEE